MYQYMVFRNNNRGFSETSNLVAESINRGPYYARLLRKWANNWIEKREVPVVNQGKHSKWKSFLKDEDVQLAVQEYLREHKFTVMPTILKDHLEAEVFPKLKISFAPSSITEETIRRWMIKMGYVYGRRKKGIYVGGHERDDVKADRQKFLKRMEELEPLMVEYDDDLQPLPFNIPLGQQQHILVTHDESTFNANDDLKYGWGPKREQPLRKKGRGAGLMISKFLLDTVGRLVVPEEQYSRMVSKPTFPREACIIFEFGKNRDGYWTGEDVPKQVCNFMV